MPEKISVEELRTYVRYDADSGQLIRLSTGNPVGTSVKHRGNHRTFTVMVNRAPVYIYVHRAVWALVHGTWPNGQIDHIDRDPSNNRVENLQDVSGSINQMNRPVTGAVPYFGVRYRPHSGKYEARVKKDGKQHHIGTYSTAVAAAKARDKIALMLHGSEATLNFPRKKSPI